MSTQTLSSGEMTRETRASLRKSNKPIMEKRRRARINSCLTQLKSLVLEGMRKDSSQYSKLEKADILEMTVRHLRNVQRQQMSSAIATDPNVVTKYRAGFNECAGEVFRYLNNVQCVNEDAKSKIVNHLSHCLQNVNTQSKSTLVQRQQPVTSLPSQVQHPANVQQTTTLIQPLTVQIPHQTNNSAQQYSSSSLSSIGSSSSSSSGSFVQQPQATCLLMPGNVSQTCQPSTSPTLVNISTPVTVNNQNISGSFQIVPGNMYNGPVAVYVGQVNNDQQKSPPANTAVPVYTMQVQQQQQQQQQQQDTTNSIRKIKEKAQTKQFADSQNNFCKSELNVANFHSHEQVWRPW